MFENVGYYSFAYLIVKIYGLEDDVVCIVEILNENGVVILDVSGLGKLF